VSGSEAPGGGRPLGGRYRLLRRLGSGGMAAVWLARDERLGREVAVKVLSDVLAGDEGYRRRFEREARVAARLSHPGLVGVLDFGAESGRPYLVMELVRGDTLAERLAAGTTRGLDLVALARELLGALAHIHAAGVVHRDVKPANVLIGADGHARLTDFGVARPTDASTLTQTGQVVGTLAYMAPEVQRGEPATPRSDLYALGVLLRECGGGREPALASLIERLSAPDPAGRPASAERALAILAGTAGTVGPAADTEDLAATEPTAVLGPSARHHARAPLGRHRRLTARWLVAALAAPGAVAIALAVALASGDGESQPDTGQPRQATQRQSTTDGQAAEAGTRAPSTQPESAARPGIDCSTLEQQKKTLEEEKKAAEESAGDDQDAKKALEEQFEAEKKTLEQQTKTCK
jgi:hypothetical protein